jgi:hypothetical protein
LCIDNAKVSSRECPKDPLENAMGYVADGFQAEESGEKIVALGGREALTLWPLSTYPEEFQGF